MTTSTLLHRHPIVLCILMAIFCALFGGCTKSNALDTLAVENAKFRAENDLLKAENHRLTEELNGKNKTEAERSRKEACLKNLRRIGEAVDFWALENRKGINDQPTAADLAPYVKMNALVCPSGGLYSLGTPETPASCTIHGNPLAQK
jgi:hypothetical protein